MHSHVTGHHEKASDEKPQTDVDTDAATTKAEPAQSADLSNASEATATASAEYTNELTTAHRDGAEPAEQPSSKVDDLATGGVLEEASEMAATHQDEHDDHIVEGEEDTVIY
jgi:hypothetical protein